ncbi:hypothetical protein ACFQ5J_01430 [Lacticaseibacillus baoqingensis]|uniref:Uncharacterized protein n=1 Tax=Lacticaseibacillus baoqingensis TaxID=2486013 RepID=A0ABW4E5W5_9LACO|nr:hypothetical protein [Lacticaseibacillus baoqingensis]
MRYLILLLSVLTLSACHRKPPAAAPAPTPAASSRASHASASKRLQAQVADLLGHAFVDRADHSQALVFTASTSGYFMDVQTRSAGQTFTTSDAGIFAADITVSQLTYTIKGQAQPHAATGTMQFVKRSATTIQQLPDGPVYRRVKNDDLSTIK